MKRMTVLFFSAFVVLAANAYGQLNTATQFDSKTVRAGFHVYGENNYVNATTFEFVARDSGYTHLAANDSLEIVADAAADSGRIKIVGIGTDSSRIVKYVRFSGTDTARTTGAKFLAIESVTMDSTRRTSAGAMVGLTDSVRVKRATGNTHLTQIETNRLADLVAQKFICKNEYGYVTQWGVNVLSTVGSIQAELRYYPSVTSSRVATANYHVIDKISLPAVLGGRTVTFAQPVNLNERFGLPSNLSGWVAVYVLGGSANSQTSAFIQGYITNQ